MENEKSQSHKKEQGQEALGGYVIVQAAGRPWTWLASPDHSTVFVALMPELYDCSFSLRVLVVSCIAYCSVLQCSDQSRANLLALPLGISSFLAQLTEVILIQVMSLKRHIQRN